MAPGWSTYSAKSHGETTHSEKSCDVTTKSGTSMAAPTAAGIILYHQKLLFIFISFSNKI